MTYATLNAAQTAVTQYVLARPSELQRQDTQVLSDDNVCLCQFAISIHDAVAIRSQRFQGGM